MSYFLHNYFLTVIFLIILKIDVIFKYVNYFLHVTMFRTGKFIFDATAYECILDYTLSLLIDQLKWKDNIRYEIIVAKCLDEKTFRVLYVKKVNKISALIANTKNVVKKRSNAIRNAKLRMYDPDDTYKDIMDKEKIYGQAIKHYTSLEIFFEGTPKKTKIYIGNPKTKRYYSCDDIMALKFESNKLNF